MGSLSGTITNLVSETLDAARVVLVPADPLQAGVELTLASDGTFASGTLPDGVYHLEVRFNDIRQRRTIRTATFTVSGATALTSSVLTS